MIEEFVNQNMVTIIYVLSFLAFGNTVLNLLLALSQRLQIKINSGWLKNYGEVNKVLKTHAGHIKFIQKEGTIRLNAVENTVGHLAGEIAKKQDKKIFDSKKHLAQLYGDKPGKGKGKTH